MKVPPGHRIEELDDVLELLERAALLIERDTNARGAERGRSLAAVAAAALRVVEIREVAERLEAVEQALKLRGA